LADAWRGTLRASVRSCQVGRLPRTDEKSPATSAIPPALTRAEARALQGLCWPDVWAEDLKLEVDAHPFDLRGREYQRDILRDESKYIVIPKGAQEGLTTVFILKSCHAIVVRRKSVLYLLPLKAGSVQFVQGRIDPILDSNKNLASNFSRTDNRVMKATAKGVKWYIRGTNIPSELREAPADVLVLDERDVANEENLPDAYARLDGSDYARVYELSTPTVDGHGVYADDGWESTDKMRWWVACPHCSSYQVLSFEENVLPFLGETLEQSKDACRCSHCHKAIRDDDRANMNATGKWVPDEPGREKRGYHLSQLNSPTKTLADDKLGILVNWFLGQTDSAKLKAFYNLGLGLAYASPGDKFTVELLDKARRDYSLGGLPDGQLCIGVDVGHDVLYVTIWISKNGRRRLWRCETVVASGAKSKWTVFEDDYLKALSGWICVCDAHPDKEEVEALSKKYSGRFWMGFEKDRPDQEATAKFQEARWGEPAKVMIDRTMAFDSYIKLYIDGKADLPREARDLGEHMPKKGYNGFYHHHLQMTCVQQADASDRLIKRWVNGKVKVDGTKQSAKSGNRPDHFHHSSMFAFVASLQDAPLDVPVEVGDLFRAAGGLIAA
jgi:hypothetical protein